jgi:D-alanyl-D-alanine carboxypeptidase
MKRLKLLFLIFGLIVLGYFGTWFYSRYFLNFSGKISDNFPETPFYLAAQGQADLYPIRDWKVADPNLNAEIALVSDIDTGFIFFQKNLNLRRPIASITKLMTALLAKKQLASDAPILVSEKAINIDGAKINSLQAGEIFKTNDLMKIMLLISSNKAAEAFAESLDGQDFVGLMNAEAKNLNMTRTSFADSSGLNMANQSTAEDLKRLAQYILENYPEIIVLTQTDQTTVVSQNLKIKHLLNNINLMAQAPQILKDLNIKYLGGKTGFTDEAKETYLGLFIAPSSKFSGQERRLLIVVLNSGSRYNDVETLLKWVKSAYVF